VPGFESIIDQKRPIRILTTCLRNGNIPHALMFTGISGIGKRTTARLFSKACNCELLASGDSRKRLDEIPCCRCRSCRKIKSGNHPDIIHIKPSGNIIKIAQIRNLCHTLSMKPYEAKMRVVTISEAQNLNLEAGNALLKVLEEPPEQTIIILTALNTANLLPTIVSRCQEIRFGPISRKNLMRLLHDERGTETDVARIIAAMANGSISKALAMSDDQWINQRNWLIHELEILGSRSIRGVMAFAEKLSSKKDKLPDALEVILTWLRDLWMVGMDPEKIVNIDRIDGIQSNSGRVPPLSLLSKITAVQRAQKELQANTNLRLMLENLMLQLVKI
jgi:DNA polymerase-3 subunit delta'